MANILDSDNSFGLAQKCLNLLRGSRDALLSGLEQSEVRQARYLSRKETRKPRIWRSDPRTLLTFEQADCRSHARGHEAVGVNGKLTEAVKNQQLQTLAQEGSKRLQVRETGVHLPESEPSSFEGNAECSSKPTRHMCFLSLSVESQVRLPYIIHDSLRTNAVGAAAPIAGCQGRRGGDGKQQDPTQVGHDGARRSSPTSKSNQHPSWQHECKRCHAPFQARAQN